MLTRVEYWLLVGLPVTVLVLMVIVGLWSWGYDQSSQATPTSRSLIPHFIHHGVQRETTARPYAVLPPIDWQPGDVVVVAGPDDAYGKWTHASLYLGDQQFFEADIFHGLAVRGPTALVGVHALVVLRPHCSAAIRSEAAERAKALAGQPFHLLARSDEETWWSCAKVASACYAEAGFPLTDALLPLPGDLISGGQCAVVVRAGGSE